MQIDPLDPFYSNSNNNNILSDNR